MKPEKINNISDVGLCLKTLIKFRFNRDTKVIYNSSGRYKSLYISFFKNHAWQFYVEAHGTYYLIYLLKDNKIVKKDMIRKGDTVERFYTRILPFIRLI